MATTTLTITRAASSQSGSSLLVNILLGGTATLNTDFTLASGTAVISGLTAAGFALTIPANSLTGSVVLTTTPDSTYEADETVSFTISPTPGVSSGNDSATYTIANDDIEIQVLTISLSSLSSSEG
jgi:hypothetical protein